MSAPVVRRTPVRTAVIVAVTDLTPRMRRITVRSESMVDVAIRPAQDVELLLSGDGGRRVKRRYTIRHARPRTGELDLDVFVHGHGPGSAWAAAARPGDAIEFQGPRGKLELTSAAWHLLVGDESALPAISAVCEALPPAEHAIAVLEVGDASDELPLPSTTDVHWVHRGTTAAGGAELLAAAVAGLVLPGSVSGSLSGDAGGHGYLMGETRAMVALRSLLEGRGLSHEAVFVKGYWNVGRPDRLAGRAPD